MRPAEYAKALVGAVGTLLSSLATTVHDGLSAADWLAAAAAALLVGSGVAATRNADRRVPELPGDEREVTADDSVSLYPSYPDA